MKSLFFFLPLSMKHCGYDTKCDEAPVPISIPLIRSTSPLSFLAIIIDKEPSQGTQSRQKISSNQN